MIRRRQRGIWETRVKNLNLKNPETLRFYIERKINIGDWDAIDKTMLAAVLPKLSIDPYLKYILEKFINEEKHTTSHAGTA